MSDLGSIGEIADVLHGLVEPGRRLVVAIVGAPGAGKSTIAQLLAAELSAVVLPMDGFHLSQARLVQLSRRDRMGAADTFDVDGFVAVLTQLHAGYAARTSGEFKNSGFSVLAAGFDREVEESIPNAIDISPEIAIVLVEGNYLLLGAGGWDRAAPEFDVSFFVAIDDALRIERLVDRHTHFGKSPDDARAWALGPDEVNAKLIATTASRADHIIRLA